MKQAIVCSDLHLLKKPGMWSGRADIQGDDAFALTQIIDLCINHKTDLYILGDVLDVATTLPRPLVLLQEEFSRLRKACPDSKVYFIQGQHEMSVQSYAEHKPWLSLIEGTEHIAGKSFDFLGSKAYAVDYFPPGFITSALSDMPEDTKVLFLHGTADIAMPFSPHFSVQDIPTNVELILAGDYHKPIELSYPRSGQEKDGTLVYCGSTWMGSVSEFGPKYVLLVTQQKDGVPHYERVELKTRPIYQYSRLSDGELEALPDRLDLPEIVRRPLVLVDLPMDAEELAELANKAFVYVTKTKPDNTEIREEVLDALPPDQEILAKYISPIDQKSQFDFVMDIITSNVPDAVARVREHLAV